MSYQGCSLRPRRECREGSGCPLIIVPAQTMAELAAAQAEGSVSIGAALLQLSCVLFSTAASGGWHEVQASVHQPHTRPSSQESKTSKG